VAGEEGGEKDKTIVQIKKDREIPRMDWPRTGRKSKTIDDKRIGQHKDKNAKVGQRDGANWGQ